MNIDKIKSVIGTMSTFCLIFLIGAYIGNFGRTTITEKDITEVEIQSKTDAMPLENGGKVVIELVSNQRLVYLSYEDLQYISKKKSKMKKLVQNLNALFKRLE